MKVTLRKAHALSEAIKTAAVSLQVPASVTISVYDPVDEKNIAGYLTDARDQARNVVEEAEALTKAAFAIRAMIGAENAKCGVDELLAEKAALDSVERILNSLTGAVGVPVERVTAELKALRETTVSDSIRARRDALTVSVINEEMSQEVKNRLAAVRRRKVAIADELLTLNMTRKVTLSDQIVELLTKHQLI